jgi:hypothetical protein
MVYTGRTSVEDGLLRARVAPCSRVSDGGRPKMIHAHTPNVPSMHPGRADRAGGRRGATVSGVGWRQRPSLAAVVADPAMSGS